MKFGVEVDGKHSYVICESYLLCCLCCEVHAAYDSCTVGMVVKSYCFF